MPWTNTVVCAILTDKAAQVAQVLCCSVSMPNCLESLVIYAGMTKRICFGHCLNTCWVPQKPFKRLAML